MAMRSRCIFGFTVFLLLAHNSSAQEKWNWKRATEQDSNFNKKVAIIGGLVVQQAGSAWLEYNWWWKGNYHEFILQPLGEESYSKQIDKAGHFYTSYVYFTMLNEVMRWGGFSDKTRLKTATIIPFFYALSIEIGDGFSHYNFSLMDLGANTLGIAYGLLQEKVPYMQNFNVKFSYFPSQYQYDTHFADWHLPADYDGHIYWITANMHHILPGKPVWPEFLNLAAGYGVVGFHPANNWRATGELFIGLDYNLGAFKPKNKTLLMLVRILDKAHFPGPGFKKTGDGKLIPKWWLLN